MCRGNRFLRLSIISVISLQNISEYAEGSEHLFVSGDFDFGKQASDLLFR
jgi:hypothetical protein